MARTPRDSWSFGTPYRPLYMRPRLRRLASIVAMTLSLAMITSSSLAAVYTDKWEYTYGETVQITGDQMWPGEQVSVDVSFPDGTMAQNHVVTADEAGNFADTFYLADGMPSGIYGVFAIGLSSGSTFTTEFDPAASSCMNGENPTATGPTQTSLTINWLDDCNNENRFVINYGTTSGSLNSSVTVAASAGDNNARTHALSGLTCGTTYFFTVKAEKDDPGGQSSTSNQGSAATSACAPVNTTPGVAFNGAPTTANEGQTKTFNFNITDPDTSDSWTFVTGYPSCGANGSFVTGSASINNAVKTGTFQCTFPDGDATSDVKVKVKDAANAQSNEATTSVAISNVAPTVSSLTGPNPVNEHGSNERTYTYSISDPGVDSITGVTTSCGTGGTKVAGSDSFNNTSGSFKCVFPDGPASPQVSASATDSDGATGNTDTFDVTVNNVAPTVSGLGGPTPVNENGVTQHMYSYSINDPGVDVVTGVTTSCGSGGTKVALSDSFTNTSGSFKCIFPDGPDSSSVSVSATDSDGATGNTATHGVTVDNVAPTVSNLSGPSPVNEGSTERTYTYSISDPGTDSIIAVTTSCGVNGTKVSGSDSFNGTSGSFKCVFSDGEATSEVSASATDSDNETGNTDTFDVTVDNVAPTVSDLTGPSPVNEGSTQRTYTYSIADPGDDTITGVTTSCGTGGSKVSGSDSFDGTSGSFECTFPDGPASPQVSASATDSDGATGNTDTFDVTVNNVAPTVSGLSGPSPVNEGSTQRTYTYSISDPGDDTITGVTTSCGTGGSKVSGSDSFDGTSGSFQCVFDDGPASPQVSASATDSDSATGSAATFNVTVDNVAPTVSSITPNKAMAAIGELVTFTGAATDPSSADTSHGFHWAWNSGAFGPDHSATYTTSFNSCGSKTVQGRAQDKDGGTSAAFTSGAVSIVDVQYRSPLVPGTYNLVQKGRVVPVKVTIGCNGGFQTGLQPKIQLMSGDLDPTTDPGDGTQNVDTISVSNADTTGIMREVDGQYIYNLAVPSNATVGQKFTIRVNLGGGVGGAYIVLQIRK